MNHPNRNFKFKVMFLHDSFTAKKDRVIGKFNFHDEALVFLKAMEAYEPHINGRYALIMPDGSEFKA